MRFFASPLLILALLVISIARASGQGPASSTATVTSVSFQGNEHLLDSELRNVIPMRSGESYDAERVEISRKMLLSYYETRGHMEAKVTARADARQSSVRVFFEIVEGPLYTFGKTSVQGLTGLPERTVFRELSYREGDLFSQRELFRTQARLYNLGLFEEIRMQTSTTPVKAVDVWIFLKSRPAQKVRGGVGYGSEERQRINLIYSDQNFLHRAYRLELFSTYSGIWLEAGADLMNRYLFGTHTESRGSVSWRNEDREGYDLERVLGQVNLARRLPYNVYVTPRYRLQRTITFNVNPEVSATTPEKSLTSALEVSSLRDTTNDPFFPYRGGRASVSVERSGGIFGGDIHFQKYFYSASRFWAIAGPVVTALQVRGGTVWEFPPSKEVPIFERLFTGGANSIRGYRERGVGPKDDRGAPLGGNVQMGGSVELRFPLYRRFNGAVFVDGGQVAQRASGAKPSEWKYGAGGGVRFKTPVGPFRLDYGYKLNPDPDEEDLWRVHLSLGEAF
ncbi:MAG: BamA/TamA family outer membrane protein [Elusimicrobia bacterium]|nr:BamA/TamA family outer membrane protein [Elusimicrobiota bacterium]